MLQEGLVGATMIGLYKDSSIISQVKVSSIKLDFFYVLTKGINGVKAKFIGAPWMGSKKKVIWVPKSLITNLQGL